MSALIIVFALWWVYFCEAEHLPRADAGAAFLWGYGHVLIFCATAVTGAAIGAEVDLASHHSQVTQAEVARYLGLALAVLHLVLWVIRDRLLPLPAARRLALPAMATAFALAALAGLPAWAFALLSIVTVWWRAPVTGVAAAGPGKDDHGRPT